MTPLTSPECRTVRTWLTAAHDDELSVRRHVLLDAHLASCAHWRHRVRDVIDDGQRLWMIGGALVVAAFVGLAAPTHPGSLAGLMRTSTALGSNANPLWLVAGVTLPRVAADTRAKAMLIQPLRPLGIPNLALTAVVTREGQHARRDDGRPRPPADSRPVEHQQGRRRKWNEGDSADHRRIRGQMQWSVAAQKGT